ncbi:hypothetical protein MtrunA17_Chr8g0368311 [Medicago truncatula]|uniref:Transmembrane protein, putative n=1 Tax=Medicago truncatula TaxID=3880 RepID=A0A072TRP1_MEDTR|nr:transmembrane protein, putative [Medicago truncatula]RHN41650.1 hypothetical protein MtrunA17_Chr8g0368311 [Medicago truncatula]
MYVSFGGCIVVLNAVLNLVPIFLLSYLKMQVNLWKKIVKIQIGLENGLSGCFGGRIVVQHVEGAKLGSCVGLKGKMVYQHIENGGLRVRDVRVVKLILLVKWEWMLLQSDQPTWKELVVEKYGREVERLLEGSGLT